MDTVPYAFVDFVTELLTHWSIGELVNIRAWTEIAQVHKQERRSYGINFWCTEQGVQGAFIRAYSGPSPYLNVKEVLKTERRFLRIWHFANTESIKPPRDQKRLLTFKYDQLAKLEKFIVSHSYAHLSVYNKKLQPSLLNAFFRKVYFTAGISLTNNCPLAADFVKDQMEHSTTLLHVNLRKKWDPSMLPYIKKFCLRPNVMLFRSASVEFTLDVPFVQELMDVWRTDGEFKRIVHFARTPEIAEYMKSIMQQDGAQYVLIDKAARKVAHYTEESDQAHFSLHGYSRCYLCPPSVLLTISSS